MRRSSAPATGLFELFDRIASNVLLPVDVALVVVFVGWFYDRDEVEVISPATDRVRNATPVWTWHVCSVLLIAVVMTLAFTIVEFAGLATGG